MLALAKRQYVSRHVDDDRNNNLAATQNGFVIAYSVGGGRVTTKFSRSEPVNTLVAGGNVANTAGSGTDETVDGGEGTDL